MKCVLQIVLLGSSAVLLSSCSRLTSPNSQTFDPSIDPLDSPGKRTKAKQEVEIGPKFAPGSYVEVTDANAGFYRKYPRGSEQPDYRLGVGTPLKVVGGQGSYVEVETESGQIGYVPAIMVSSKSSGSDLPIIPAEKLKAPVPASPEPIDPIDLTPLPPTLPDLPHTPGADDLPFVAPEPEVPPISVEDSPAPAPSVVPPDPVDPRSP